MAEVRFIRAAECDAQEALDWYRSHGARAASGFEKALAEAAHSIGKNPELYPLIDDRHRRCSLHRYPYSLIYRARFGPHHRSSTLQPCFILLASSVLG